MEEVRDLGYNTVQQMVSQAITRSNPTVHTSLKGLVAEKLLGILQSQWPCGRMSNYVFEEH